MWGKLVNFATVTYRECKCKNPECDLYEEVVETIEIDREDWDQMRQIEDPFKDVEETKRAMKANAYRERARKLARRAADDDRFRAFIGTKS